MICWFGFLALAQVSNRSLVGFASKSKFQHESGAFLFNSTLFVCAFVFLESFRIFCKKKRCLFGFCSACIGASYNLLLQSTLFFKMCIDSFDFFGTCRFFYLYSKQLPLKFLPQNITILDLLPVYHKQPKHIQNPTSVDSSKG